MDEKKKSAGHKDKLEGIEIGFVSGGLPDGDEVELRGVHGVERLSQLFSFDLHLARPTPFSPVEIDDLLSAPCAIVLGTDAGDVVHGILDRIRLVDSTGRVAARYVARLVPTLSLLTLTRTSRIYQDRTVPGLVSDVLGAYSLSADGYEVRVSHDDKSPTHEYVVQYQESDWDFLQRWFEREGFFYWFVHDKDGEKLVIADDNGDATEIAAPSTLSYREINDLSTGGDATVWDWTVEQRRVASQAAVHDYNYRTPTTALIAAHDVDKERGFGSVFHYGEHFKTTDAGKLVAKLRAERLYCERRTFRGSTDCSRIRVGHTFELENHHDAAHDGKYLITAIEHRVGHPIHGPGDPQRYLARFEAIPLDVPFRPEQRTPWPRIHGVMHAHVESEGGDGTVAMLDSDGRYKVKMPFDVSGVAGGVASRWIRMAQPYAGAGYGSHHPLHRGTEVLVAHLDGDPDRPVIVGSVPNAHTPSPVTSANATQSVVQTSSGIRVELEDLQP